MLHTIEERSLPKLKGREEMLSLMLANVYGFMPPAPTDVRFQVERNVIPHFCAGKATCDKVTAVCEVGDSSFAFPFYVTVPTGEGPYPFFVHISFRPDVTDRYQPTEELVDAGFAVLSFDYNAVTKDDGDFTDGLASVLYTDGIRKRGTDCGKIAMWAWAAHRVMDYAQTLGDVLDLRSGVVCGHSRLGKTALLAGATDQRFAYVYSNDSGCSGAAITRGKGGETVQAICERFPYWFCTDYQQYMEREDAMPFDQHYLLASIAPRKVLVGSASEDPWADPVAEQLCCFAAAPAFAKGFVCPDRPAAVGEAFLAGDVGYHLRRGLHYFSREDWHALMQFVNLHRSI